MSTVCLHCLELECPQTNGTHRVMHTLLRTLYMRRSSRQDLQSVFPLQVSACALGSDPAVEAAETTEQIDRDKIGQGWHQWGWESLCPRQKWLEKSCRAACREARCRDQLSRCPRYVMSQNQGVSETDQAH